MWFVAGDYPAGLRLFRSLGDGRVSTLFADEV